MNQQQAILAALAIDLGEKVLTINQLRAELQQANATIVELEAKPKRAAAK